MSYVYENNIENMKEFLGVVKGERGRLYEILKEFFYNDVLINDILNGNNSIFKELENILKGNGAIYKDLKIDGKYVNTFEHCKGLSVRQCIKDIMTFGYFSNNLEKGKKIYIDPDQYDKKLYKYINENKYDGFYECKGCNLIKDDFRFSLDCVSGWKAIMDVLCMEKRFVGNEMEFIKKYEIIRNPKNAGHLLWTVHFVPTINTKRYKEFKDRVDYTLYDIKMYYKFKKSKILNELINKQTLDWLDNSFEDFDDFIKKMKLERWCVIKNGRYEVIDLSSLDMSEIITGYLDDGEEYLITKEYIDNLLKKVED